MRAKQRAPRIRSSRCPPGDEAGRRSSGGLRGVDAACGPSPPQSWAGARRGSVTRRSAWKGSSSSPTAPPSGTTTSTTSTGGRRPNPRSSKSHFFYVLSNFCCNFTFGVDKKFHSYLPETGFSPHGVSFHLNLFSSSVLGGSFRPNPPQAPSQARAESSSERSECSTAGGSSTTPPGASRNSSPPPTSPFPPISALGW